MPGNDYTNLWWVVPALIATFVFIYVMLPKGNRVPANLHPLMRRALPMKWQIIRSYWNSQYRELTSGQLLITGGCENTAT